MTEPKNSKLRYIIDLKFRNINRLFVFTFKNNDSDSKRNSFDKYYIPLARIKDFNALVNNKPFYNQSVKNKQEA